jgi:hypothetical protein
MTAQWQAARFDRGRSPQLYRSLFARKCATVASTRGLHAARGHEAAATIARGYQYAALSPGRYGHRYPKAQVEADGRRDIANSAKAGHSWCLGTTAFAHFAVAAVASARAPALSDRASPMAEKTFAEILEDATNRSRDMEARSVSD